MPVAAEVVSYFMSNKNLMKKIEFQIVLQCAPLLKGMKAACTVNVEHQHVLIVRRMFCRSEISCRILSSKDGKYLLLLYREEWLKNQMETEEMKEFLLQFGYREMGLQHMLSHLEKRAGQFAAEGMGFPHEIGVFLGYPAEDVKGFIKYQGKQELMSGYWKVYSNPFRAEMMFDSYDRAKVWAVNEYLTGKSIAEIAAASSMGYTEL